MEGKINIGEFAKKSEEKRKPWSRDCPKNGTGGGEEMESRVDDDKVSYLDKQQSSPLDIMENSTDHSSDSPENLNSSAISSATDGFKKPTVLIGPRRFRPPGKIPKTSVSTDACTPENIDCCSDRVLKSMDHSKDPPFPYVEPLWGGKPEQDYKMEVLKSGVIVDTIPLNEQSFYIVGRLPSCHVSLAHPTISRYHAVFQYRYNQDEENSKGFYVYDLGSTHGTFWNGNRIKSNIYVRIQGGHMLRFGCSQRKYILQAPSGDEEEESQYTMSQLKEMRTLELGKRCGNKKADASISEKENDGIDWGMGEDADEETDLQENPYACIADDDLVLEDPKKTLRGWFEREGYDLQYQTEEKGLGQFLCWVDLPMEDIVGRSVRAEALVKGKKREAVVQCALEACKILDKYGLLRQANHEARKRKTRNWEAEDYYDSDEDNFLDRTGSVEKKREQRMRLAGKLEEKVETYDSLLEKHKEVTKRISYLLNSIKNWQNKSNANKDIMEEDALDAFMSSLSWFALTKSDIAKMKIELQCLRKEETSIIKLLNLTRPANLPALICHTATTDQVTRNVKTKTNLTRETLSVTIGIQDPALGLGKAGNKSFSSSTMKAESEEEMKSEEEVESKLSRSTTAATSTITATVGVFTTATAAATTATTATTATNKSVGENENEEKYAVGQTKRRRQKVACDQDTRTNNYSTWVPPQDQLGDGKTSLNEKYGY
ncbi:kanadaptin isoform X2 [Andrena cerasifolii]|uniref:kanadaptin isoform X2 n=1 Tax=Andrena cerasifolii TaxID=2819439 RepID=UPI0040383274